MKIEGLSKGGFLCRYDLIEDYADFELEIPGFIIASRDEWLRVFDSRQEFLFDTLQLSIGSLDRPVAIDLLRIRLLFAPIPSEGA